MNEIINPLCNSYAIRCMDVSTTKQEASGTFPFGSVSSAEEVELAIDEVASTMSLLPNPPVSPIWM